MNAKNVLNRIKTLLTSQEVKFATAKLADGTVVESPAFAVGDVVEVITEEGRVPAPDGEHELVVTGEDDTELIVKIQTEGGIITEREEQAVGEVQAEEEVKEDVETEAVEDVNETTELEAEEDPIQKLAYRIDELEKKVAMYEDLLPKMKEEVVDKDAEIVDLEEEELPKLDGAPVEKPKVNMSKKANSPQNLFLSKLYK